jgi:hypothetical protein
VASVHAAASWLETKTESLRIGRENQPFYASSLYQFGSQPPLIARGNVVPMTRTERRLAERFGLKIPLRVGIGKSAALEHTAESLNVSTRGISFATDLPLCNGTPVHLAFEMPEQVTHKPASEWRCTGHVVHVQPNGSAQGANCVGVGFDCYEVLLPVRPSVHQVSQLG